MTTILSLFSTFITPIIALFVWCVLLYRLRSLILMGLTALSLLLIIITADGNLLLFTRNPYAMLMFITLVSLNVLIVPYHRPQDKPYLITANSILLGMITALHLWRIYLRQSSLYFTEQAPQVGLMLNIILTVLGISLPFLLLFIRSKNLYQ